MINIFFFLHRERDLAVAGNTGLVESLEEHKSQLKVSQEAVIKLEEANACLEERCTKLLSEIKSLENEMESLAQSKIQLDQVKAVSENESSQVHRYDKMSLLSAVIEKPTSAIEM